MHRNDLSIYSRNMRVFYVVDSLRGMFFLTSVWVIFERQYLTMSQLTLVEAFIIGITLLAQLPTGAFADLFGKKRAMIIGCVLFSISVWFYSISTTFSMFLVYAVLYGVGQAFIDGTREALLYDTLKQDKIESRFSKVASKLSMIFQVSLAAATIVGGWIGLFSYVLAIRLTAVMFLCAGIASAFFIEPAIDTEKFSLKNYVNKTKQGVQELFKNSYIKKISLYYIMIGSLTWVCAITFNMVLLTEMQYSTSQIGIAVAATRIINSVIIFRLLHIGTFFTRKRTFIFLPILLIVAFLPTIFMTKWWAIIPVIGAMFVSTARWNILSHYTNAEFDSRNRATAISALCMVVGIVYVVIVGSSGYIMERFGGIRTMYTILGLITLVTALPLGIHLSNIHKNDPAK